MADIAGTCYFAADGQNYALVGEVSYQISGYSRETLMGMDGYHGRKLKPKQGMMKAKIRNLGAVSLAVIAAWSDITAQFELANGKTVIGTNMALLEPPTSDAEEAEIELTLEGPSVVES